MTRPTGLSPARHVLANGAVVTVKEAHAVPAVAIHAMVRAGSVCDGPDVSGLAHFASRTIDRGTLTRSADDIALSLDSRGITLSVTVNRHALSLACQCLAEDAEAALDLVGDLLRTATYPDAQVERLRAEILTGIQQDEENPAVMASEGLLRLLYPGHPYAARPRGSADSLSRITPGDLRVFHRDHITPGECSLAIVGDVNPAEAREAAERALEGWTGGPPAVIQFPPVVPLDARHRLVVPLPGKPQADIAYGFTTILRSDPTYYA